MEDVGPEGGMDATKEKKSAKALNNLNECELKDLLEETMAYKNPKDREGKSSLFKELLDEAEESERNARATSAGGSEQVRYCNTTAKHRSKHRRKPSSISENVMHGGSLDNLAKEELFGAVCHPYKPKRTVSARQREGGSLPSNVNAGGQMTIDTTFLEAARRRKDDGEVAAAAQADPETYTTSAVLELVETAQPAPAKFTTRATLQVNVDDALHISDLEAASEQIQAKVVQSQYNVYIKKYDENGNALSKSKKKKVQSDKNVTVVAAEKVVGHRGDIINDLNKLLEFIEDEPARRRAARPAKLHKHEPRKPKKEKKDAPLKKSNSTGDVRAAPADERERRSWGDAAAAAADASSADHLGFCVVTKKKKPKKRRSSAGAARRPGTRAPTPRRDEPRARAGSSSSDDVDSVRSLPVEATPASYAAIARAAAERRASKDRTLAEASLVDPPDCPGAGSPPDVTNFESFPAIAPPPSRSNGYDAAPPLIVDVQTIEKMHFASRPSVRRPPPRKSPRRDEPVVILSGSGANEVPGLVFGFDVNEQLLSEEVCETFCARYVSPECFTDTSHNHDKIVNFIGNAWEETLRNQQVPYFTD